MLLAARLKQWFQEKPKEPRILAYREFRSKVDKFTSKFCTEYPKLDKRKEQGAVIYSATVPEEEEMSSSVDESMLNDESSISPDNETYHCYISCRNYSSNCDKPEECRQLWKEKKTGRQKSPR